MAVDEDALKAQGWARLPMGNYSATIDPVFVSGEVGSRTLAMHTSPAMANHRPDTVHGGALMTFADCALGFAAVEAIGAPRCATAQLNFQFVRGVPVGSVVTCRPELVRRTRRLLFLRGLFEVDGEVVGSADAIFNAFE